MQQILTTGPDACTGENWTQKQAFDMDLSKQKDVYS